MGNHSARRSHDALPGLAGRGLLTAAAAFALIGGGTGAAFAGDASTDHSVSDASSDGHDHDGHDYGKDGKDGHDTKWDKHEKCVIPIYDPADEDLTAFLDKETHGEYSTLGEPVKPTEDEVHDAICPPAKDLLGGEEPGKDKPKGPMDMVKH